MPLFMSAQQHYCGTPDGRSEWLIEYQKNPDAYPRTDDILWVPVQIHIVGTDSGAGYYNATSLRRDFCDLNEQMSPSNIQFYMADDFNYVNSSQLQYHESFQEGSQVMNQIDPDFQDVINIYIAQEAAGNCGYAAYWINRVVVAHNCMGPGTSTWVHEMGHALSLPHNFNNNILDLTEADLTLPAPADFEKVDGSNCKFAGDGFCDTAPDYIGRRWSCNGDSLSGLVFLDPDSVEFRVPGKYYMSYSNDDCTSGFSQEQMNAMRAFVYSERPEFIDDQIEWHPFDESTSLTGITPEDGGELVTYTDQRLSWDPIENVTHYLVQVSILPNFAAVQFRKTTTSTSINIDVELSPNVNYYWRVGIYNPGYTCFTGYLPSNTFKTVEGTPLSNNNIELTSDLSVVPNPVSIDKTAMLNFSMNTAQDVEMEIVNMTGQVLQNQSINTVAGQNAVQINMNDLSGGLYWVVLRNENGRAVTKVVIY